MKADKIEQLLRALHVDKVRTHTKARGIVVESSCPLAPWQHKLGTDKKPSFVVFAVENDQSRAKCQACGFKGSLETMLWKIEKLGQKDLTEQMRFVRNNDIRDAGGLLKQVEVGGGWYSDRSTSAISDAAYQGRDYSDPLSIADALPALPDSHLKIANDLHDLLNYESFWYLHKKRNLSDDAIERWKIGWHPAVRRISIPQFDRNGRLVNIGGRYVESVFDGNWDPPSWMHATGFQKEMYLFGEDHIDYDSSGRGTACLVEGMFDVIYLDDKSVPNVMAQLGSFLGPYQVEKIVRWFDHLVYIPDGDKAGREAAQRISERLSPRMRVDVFPTPDDLDPDQLSDDAIRHIKSMILR